MTNKKEKKYKLGVALSGGGAKGLAHLGVLQAMNDIGLYPNIISGTSAGAFAGVLYADGYAPKEIVSFFEKKAFKEFAEFTMPQGGFFKTNGLHRFLKKHLRAKTFEDLKIPLRAVATDIEHGESRIFSSGSVVAPIVASCTVPIIFRPTEIEKRHYVDGGLLKNFPVSTIRTDCYKVIGVNVSPITTMPYKGTIKYVAERSFHYMSGSNTLLDRQLCDYLIESPDLAVYSMFDLDHVGEIYRIGYNLAQQFFEEKRESLLYDFPELEECKITNDIF